MFKFFHWGHIWCSAVMSRIQNLISEWRGRHQPAAADESGLQALSGLVAVQWPAQQCRRNPLHPQQLLTQRAHRLRARNWTPRHSFARYLIRNVTEPGKTDLVWLSMSTPCNVQHGEKSPVPGGMGYHDLLIMRRVLYRCVTSATLLDCMLTFYYFLM